MVASMSVRSLVWSAAAVVACTIIIGGACAQEKPAPPEAAEAEVLALGARELGAFGAQAQKAGFPARAALAFREVVAEYAPDDAAARKALGYYRHGTVWQRDPEVVVDGPDRPDVAAARSLEQRWQALASRLGASHRDLATALATAGRDDRARHHGERALRFLPNDAKAQALAGVRQLEGIAGDDLDLAVLERSRRFERTLTQLMTQPFAATPVDEKLPMLDGLGIAHAAVKSEHFTVFGTWDVAVLQEAAAWAERALAFCGVAFAGVDGLPPRQVSTTFVFLRELDPWQQLVRKHARPRDVDFLLENTKSNEFDGIETAAADTRELVFDLAVRWVAQDHSGLTLDALEEGIGHAVVGMFFGRNLVFTVGQPEFEGTVAGSRTQSKLLLPDLETWRELVTELAWQRDGTRAARLPLLSAAEFPSDARIKAWSFCDFLLRVDPSLLRHLQRSGSDAKNESDVATAFQKAAGRDLGLLEHRWRRFWTEDTPLRRAVVGRTTPLEATSKEAPAWLELFNTLRTAHGKKPVGWSAQLSIACKEHVEYLKANKDQRGPDREHTQLAGKVGYGNAGRTFAQGALVWTVDKKRAADLWMLLPGYRDAVLNDNIDVAGIYAEGGIVVIDAVRGRLPTRKVVTQVWPEGPVGGGRAAETVPRAVDVELLGTAVQQLLAANGRGKQKQIGYPLTLHCYAATVPLVDVVVTCQGAPLPGFLVRADNGGRRAAAEGLWVFWPAEPLPIGVDVEAAWTWTGGEHRVVVTAR